MYDKQKAPMEHIGERNSCAESTREDEQKIERGGQFHSDVDAGFLPISAQAISLCETDVRSSSFAHDAHKDKYAPPKGGDEHTDEIEWRETHHPE